MELVFGINALETSLRATHPHAKSEVVIVAEVHTVEKIPDSVLLHFRTGTRPPTLLGMAPISATS